MGDSLQQGGPVPAGSPVDFRNDSRYKRYEAALEKNLATFEAIAEWADIIAFLARLNKTLAANPQFPVVPKKLVVCKRLAQCLNPNLPAGVHERTLETYSIIFQKIGTEGLRADLPIYSFGIFPFFEYASSAVRLEVLDLITRYFIPLGGHLRSCLQSLVLALLPGLDDESSDYYPKTVKVFAAIAGCVDQRAMLEKIWTAMVISSKHRASCLNYLSRVQPKRLTAAEADDFCSGKPALVTTSLSMALDDAQTLVVRGALDTIIMHFSLSAAWLSDDHKIQLVRAALLVLIRRDMSLSRRVYSWLMESLGGAESTNELDVIPVPVAAYVTSAMRSLLASDSSSSEAMARPYRIMLHLNDKSEIMQPILDSLVLSMIETLRTFSSANPGATTDRVLVSANQVFSVLDLSQIWGNLVHAAVVASDKDNTASLSVESQNSLRSRGPGDAFADVVDVIAFGMEHLAICTDEAADSLIPLAMALLACHFAMRTRPSMREIADMLRVQLLALEKVQISLAGSLVEPSAPAFDEEMAASLLSSLPAMPVISRDTQAILSYTMTRTFTIISDAVSRCLNDREVDSTHAILAMIKVLQHYSDRLASSETEQPLQTVFLSDACMHMIATLQKHMQACRSIELFDAVVTFLLSIFERLAPLQTLAPDASTVDVVVQPVISTVMDCMWRFLGEGQLNYAHLARILCAIYPHQPVEIDSYFATRIGPSGGDIGERANAVAVVTDLWSLAVEQAECPLSFLPNTVTVLLEMMLDMTPETSRAANTWFLRSAAYMPRIIEPLLRMLVDAAGAIAEPAMTFVPFYLRPFNADQICYCFRQLFNMLDNGGPATLDALNSLDIGEVMTEALLESLPPKCTPGTVGARSVRIIWALLAICLPFMSAEGTEINNEPLRRQIESIQIAALNLLGLIVDVYAGPRMADLHAVYGLLLDKLQFMLQISVLDGQPLVVRTLDRLLQKIVSLRAQDPGAGAMPESGTLARVISEVLRRPREPAVIRAWSDFLCVCPAYFDDAFVRVVEPQCQILVQRVRSAASSIVSGTGMETHLEDTVVELSCALGDIFSTALGPHSETISRALSRSGSMPTLRSLALRTDSLQAAQGPVLAPRELRVNCVTQVIPLFLFEVGGLLSAQLEDGAFLFRSRNPLLGVCERMYQRNPQTMLYLVVEYLGARIDVSSDSALVLNSPIRTLLDSREGPFRTDLLRNLSSLFRAARDARGDLFSKLSFEALALALYYVCSCGPTTEQDGAEMLAALLPLCRDIISSLPRFRTCVYLVLASYVSVYSGPLKSLTPDRRRTMREHNDALARLVETTITLASKSNDIGLWAPSSPEAGLLSLRDDQLSSDYIAGHAKDKASGKALAAITWSLLPQIETTFGEPERVTTSLSLILNQLVLPNLKVAYRHQIPGLMALVIVRQTAAQRSLVRHWRREFWESIFLDAQFFACSLPTFQACLANMREFLASEGSGIDRMAEIIQRIPSSTSTNLFLSREMDAMNRAVMVRRLAVLAFCADLSQLKSALPSTQEKIVDVLKLGAGIAAAEVYFLLRVLFHRLGEELPMTLWPVIITELVSLYKSLLSVGGATGALLATVVQASRLVDDVMMSGCATPMLYLWVLFRSGGTTEPTDAQTTDLFTRICDRLRIPSTAPSVAVLDVVRLRQPLVPSGTVSNLANLGDFFRHISLRLDRADSFVAVRKAAQLDGFFELEFIEPFRTAD